MRRGRYPTLEIIAENYKGEENRDGNMYHVYQDENGSEAVFLAYKTEDVEMMVSILKVENDDVDGEEEEEAYPATHSLSIMTAQNHPSPLQDITDSTVIEEGGEYRYTIPFPMKLPPRHFLNTGSLSVPVYQDELQVHVIWDGSDQTAIRNEIQSNNHEIVSQLKNQIQTET